jgi:hypothetical protein
MATENADAAGTEEDEVQWASSQAYQKQTAETEDVILPDGQMKMRIAVMQPTKFASLIEEYGITDMARKMEDVTQEADLSDTGNVDLDDVDPEDLDELDDQFRVILFFKNVILPQVMKPEKVHWADPDRLGDPDWFDLSDLTDTDRMYLIGAVTGQDPDQLMDSAQDRIDSFPG